MIRLIASLILAGTALTNSVAETSLGSASIPAYGMAAGKIYRVRGSVRVTAQNSTDTLTVKVRFGTTTLTGDVLVTSAAADAVVGDVVYFDLDLVCRAASYVARGTFASLGQPGTPTVRTVHAIVANSNAAAHLVEVTGQWSVANVGNSCQLETFELYEVA